MGKRAAASRPSALGAHAPSEVHRLAQRVMSPHRMYVPPSTASMLGSIAAMSVDRMQLLLFDYGVQTEIVSGPIDGYFTVHVPLRGRLEAELVDGRQTVVPGHGLTFSPGSPVHMRWSHDLRLLVLRFEQRTLEDAMGRLVEADGSRLIFDQVLGDDAAAGMTATVRTLRRLVAASTGPLPTRVARSFADAAMSTLLLSQRHSCTELLTRSPAPSPSKRHVRRACELIDERMADELDAGTLAAAARVSERTLLAAFRAELGTTPMLHLRERRLARARELLSSGSTATRVADAAHASGFHHLGRFAGYYRERFGETPIDTLRRSTDPRTDRRTS